MKTQYKPCRTEKWKRKSAETELIIKEINTIATESPKLEITENDKTEPVTDEEIIESDPIVGIVEK